MGEITMRGRWYNPRLLAAMRRSSLALLFGALWIASIACGSALTGLIPGAAQAHGPLVTVNPLATAPGTPLRLPAPPVRLHPRRACRPHHHRRRPRWAGSARAGDPLQLRHTDRFLGAHGI